MGLFLSRFVNKIDKKGRVSVPAPFRASLSDQSFAGIVVYPHPKLPALEGCGYDRIQKMVEGHDRLDQFSDQRDDLGSIFAVSHQLAFDPEGRVMLPEDLLRYAGISEQAVFAGFGSTFQIWEPQAIDRHLSEARDRIRIQKTTLPASRPEGSGK
ncbi:MAG: division/cell wall cluster transcriptional repressor MraZ [Alphaproteobacteria bacterium]|nr:division/cell wall cluster transcriptional repressor MraZ [Alphaproteobacteria bacterium]